MAPRSDAGAGRVRLDLPQLIAAFSAARIGLSVIQLVDPDDPETWVIVANNAAASLNSQADVSHVVGQRFLEAFPAVRDTPFIEWYQEVWRTQAPRELPEIRYGDAQVPDAAFRVWLDALPDRCVLGQYVNVTLQRRAEGRLEALNATLEAQSAARTAELATSRRMLREVAYAVAHDLQTPLRHVLLLSDPDDPAPDELSPLEHIHQAATLIEERLAALLRFTGTEWIEAPRAVDLADELDAMLDALDPVIVRTGARVTHDISAGSGEVARRALRTALRQFVLNAVSFSPEGETPVVHIALTAADDTLTIEVRDAGIGVDPAHQSQIFQAFYRVHRSERFPGVGVGLAQARVAVEAAGGVIGVRSALGAGATFFARLPFRARGG